MEFQGNPAVDLDCHARLGSVHQIFPTLIQDVLGKTVVDYGCGRGFLSAELASISRTVYAVDIRPEVYRASTPANVIIGKPDIIKKVTADVVISINAFEHYSEPENVVRHWKEVLKPNGRVYLSFGPPWYHPYGSHMHFFTRLPWIHLWCPERIVMAKRAKYRHDGARKYEEVEGGLNRMSVSRCDRLLAHHGFSFHFRRDIPIRNIGWPLAISVGRELWTSRVDRILSLPT